MEGVPRDNLQAGSPAGPVVGFGVAAVSPWTGITCPSAAGSGGLQGESSQLGSVRTYRGGCFRLPCPLLPPPCLVPAVRGPWAVQVVWGCGRMSGGVYGPSTGFAGPSSRLHLSLSSTGGGVAPTTRGFEDFS